MPSSTLHLAHISLVHSQNSTAQMTKHFLSTVLPKTFWLHDMNLVPLLVVLEYTEQGGNSTVLNFSTSFFLIIPAVDITIGRFSVAISYIYIYIYIYNATSRGTRWRSWLRHCATSRKVAGSIPDDVIGIFHWHNPSGRTMALGSTQPLTEMSTRNIYSELVLACNGIALPFFSLHIYHYYFILSC